MSNTKTSTAADAVAEAFRHWDTVPALSTFTDPAHLVQTYERQSGPAHYFDADTRRFFGSRHPATPAPGVYIETQTNAPDGYPPVVVVAWVWDTSADADHRGGARLTPVTVGKFHDRATARRFAADVAGAWPVGTMTEEEARAAR
jgi:hypothetical protein